MNNDTQGPETRALAELFRARRGVTQISQTKMAEITGMTQMSISRKLKGTSPITLYEASLMAKALGMDLAQTLATALDMSASTATDTKYQYGLVAHDTDTNPAEEQETTERNHP